MNELRGVQRDLLYIIAGCDKPCGREIRDELEEYYGGPVDGRLYPNLDKLDELGLIEKESKDYHTNEYILTGEGWHVIASMQKRKRRYVSEMKQDALSSSS